MWRSRRRCVGDYNIEMKEPEGLGIRLTIWKRLLPKEKFRSCLLSVVCCLRNDMIFAAKSRGCSGGAETEARCRFEKLGDSSVCITA